MSWLASLLVDLRALPGNLKHGLRPGVEPDAPPGQRLRRSFYTHLHPIKVTRRALRPVTTFGLGIVGLTLLVLLAISGILLMIYYVPAPARAWAGMQEIEWAVTFGGVVRRLHRFAGNALVLVMALHLLRVVAMAAYRGRELNWLFGVTLLLLVLGLAFTGYLLPWDQTAFWAVTVVANMMDYVPVAGSFLQQLLLGGDRVGEQTLVRFFALHVAVLPTLVAVVVALHLWRVRRDGLASDEAQPETVFAWPHLLARETALVVATSAVTLWSAILIASPLGPPADPSQPTNPEKAPWYFLGVQEMVSQSAVIGGVLLPLVALGLLLALPYFDRATEQTGHYFGNAEQRRTLAWTGAVAVVGWLAAQVVLSRPEVVVWVAEQPGVFREWSTPSGLALAGAVVAFFFGGRATGTSRAALNAALIVLTVALVGSTVVGLLRGPDWQLFWPWQEWPGVR